MGDSKDEQPNESEGDEAQPSGLLDRIKRGDADQSARQFSQSYMKRKRKEVRKKLGLPVSPDEEEELEQGEESRPATFLPQAGMYLTMTNPHTLGVTLLHKLFARRVTLHPGNIVIKAGNPLRLQEADALRVAHQSGLPVPRVLEVGEAGGRQYIKMDYVEGETLQDLWPAMSTSEKEDVAKQLRGIVDAMRRIEPPLNLIGGCDGLEIHDSRIFMSYDAPACKDEAGFNEYLLQSIAEYTPRALCEAIKRRLKTSHRIVLSHCDIAPRNIIIKDGRVAALIDWENAGWYPEYWEYVKFFQRSAADAKDWGHFSDVIFSETYPDELINYRAISSCQ